MEVQVGEVIGTATDTRRDAQYTFLLLRDYLKTDPNLPGEPFVRIIIPGKPHFECRAERFIDPLIDRSDGFCIPSNWDGEPFDCVVGGEDYARLAEKARAMVPYSEGHFETVWVPSDPRIPF